MLGVTPKLSNSLRDKDIEPVQGFGLMRIHVVICFAEDGCSGQKRRVAQDTGPFPGERLWGARSGRPERQKGAFMGESA
jgi:hypothetical protein